MWYNIIPFMADAVHAMNGTFTHCQSPWRQVLAALLESLGHRAHFVPSGDEAVTEVQARPFDLVLMDLHMPEMDGLDATRHIRQLPAPRSQVPVAALTANALEAARRDAEAAGVNAFLTKPLRVQDLQEVVRDCERNPHRRRDPGGPVAPAPSGSG